MLFHSLEFLVFFAVVYPVHLALRRTRYMNAWLLAASYFFYGWWNPSYLVLIVGTTVVDFLVVRHMEKSARKKPWLLLSLTSNLGALFFFKYIAFFTRNVNVVLSALGGHGELPVLEPILPIGISFFTFQSISYAVDVYRGTILAERDFIRYATYVSFFPQMISGPICRAGSLIPQLRSAPKVSWDDVTEGASLFLTGAFKKIAIADYLAMYVDKVYDRPEEFQGPALALATFSFAWQIYFDFSGYTDMARGVARIMGFRLSQNFRSPYAAADLGTFWNRWNITVSHWFRDYVYIPLGGNRKGTAAASRNVLITMVASGLWHGASWTFLLWGAIHALGRVATRDLRFLSTLIAKMPAWVQRAGVFLFITFAWIFFRARSLDDAALVVLRMFTSGWADPRFPLLLLIPIAVVWGYQLLEERKTPRLRAPRFSAARVSLAVFMMGYLALITPPSTQAFIYFNF